MCVCCVCVIIVKENKAKDLRDDEEEYSYFISIVSICLFLIDNFSLQDSLNHTYSFSKRDFKVNYCYSLFDIYILCL